MVLDSSVINRFCNLSLDLICNANDGGFVVHIKVLLGTDTSVLGSVTGPWPDTAQRRLSIVGGAMLLAGGLYFGFTNIITPSTTMEHERLLKLTHMAEPSILS